MHQYRILRTEWTTTEFGLVWCIATTNWGLPTLPLSHQPQLSNHGSLPFKGVYRPSRKARDAYVPFLCRSISVLMLHVQVF